MGKRARALVHYFRESSRGAKILRRPWNGRAQAGFARRSEVGCGEARAVASRLPALWLLAATSVLGLGGCGDGSVIGSSHGGGGAAEGGPPGGGAEPSPDGGGAGDAGPPAGDGGAGEAPPSTTGTDDWPELGHDPGKSFASTEALPPPLKEVWAWAASSNPALSGAMNSVSAGGQLHVHAIGNGPRDHSDAANNPYLQSLDLGSGASSGTYTTNLDYVNDTWFSATASQVVINSDGLQMVEAASHTRKIKLGPVDGITVGGDHDGETIIDRSLGRLFAINTWQFHDPKSYPSSYAIPPSHISAFSLGSGKRLWTANIARYPVKMAESMAYGGGKLFVSARYGGSAADGSPTPANGLYAFDGAGGAVAWMKSPPSGTVWKAVSTDGARVFVAALAGSTLKVVALDAATGSEVFASPSLGSANGALPPGYAGDRLFVYSGASLVALDRGSGMPVWTKTGIGGTVPDNGFALAPASGVVYVTRGSGVAAHQTSDGAQIWSTSLGKVGTVLAPVIARGRLVVTGTRGVVALAP